MPTTHAEVVALLKHELLFIERGGYRSTRFAWRPALLIEDSFSCPRDTFGGKCFDKCCPWLAFVALKHHGEITPCRHLVIGEHGETIDLLYRTATCEEYEESFRRWLVETIARLEEVAA